MTREKVIVVLTKDLRTTKFKDKLEKLDVTIVAKCGDPFTQAGVEEFVVDNILFGDE